MEEQKTRVEIDPITGEVNTILEEPEEVTAEKQIWGKNPARTQAIRDLMFDELIKHIDQQNIPEEKRLEMVFLMAVNSTIDLMLDSATTELALDMTYCFDNMVGMALANKKYNVDILEEAKKAMQTVDPEKFETDEQYLEELQAFEEHWWDMGQPALGMRSPNDAIYETLRKYGLND